MGFIQFIADYGKNDPAFAEVVQRLQMEMPGVVIKETSVYPFSTVETGFWTAQFALSQAPGGTVIFTNCAPRFDNPLKREDNQGEKLVYAQLKNGVEIVGVNSGFSFSFIKNEIVEFWSVNVEDKGSQFRSRDFFPRIVGMVFKGNYSFKQRPLEPKKIPDPPKNQILAVDGYGNIKTSFKRKDFAGIRANKKMKVKIGDQIHVARFQTGAFNVKHGELAFAEGSSGFDGFYLELFLRGGSASKLFNFPIPGESVYIEF